MGDDAAINQACHRLLTSAEFAPLLAWWELQLLNAALPPGPVDPLRLAMRQGDGERLLGIKLRAQAHKTMLEGPKNG